MAQEISRRTYAPAPSADKTAASTTERARMADGRSSSTPVQRLSQTDDLWACSPGHEGLPFSVSKGRTEGGGVSIVRHRSSLTSVNRPAAGTLCLRLRPVLAETRVRGATAVAAAVPDGESPGSCDPLRPLVGRGLVRVRRRGLCCLGLAGSRAAAMARTSATRRSRFAPSRNSRRTPSSSMSLSSGSATLSQSPASFSVQNNRVISSSFPRRPCATRQRSQNLSPEDFGYLGACHYSDGK